MVLQSPAPPREFTRDGSRQIRVPDYSRPRAIPADIIRQWAYHDLAHLRQIMGRVQARLVTGMGSTRASYPETEALASWQHA